MMRGAGVARGSLCGALAGLTAFAGAAIAGPPDQPVSGAPAAAATPPSFIPTARASEILLLPRPTRPGDEPALDVAAQRALIERAESERRAAAEVRAQAEALSRRFATDTAPVAEPAPAAGHSDAADATAGAADRKPVQAFGVAAPPPVAAGPHPPLPAVVAVPAASAPDPLEIARREAADAVSRAEVERNARLAAEIEARIAIEHAAAAVAKAQEQARLAARRAAEAEARALKSALPAARKVAKPAAVAADAKTVRAPVAAGKAVPANGAIQAAAAVADAPLRPDTMPPTPLTTPLPPPVVSAGGSLGLR